jgi:type III secretion system HrpE/YscL family protein
MCYHRRTLAGKVIKQTTAGPSPAQPRGKPLTRELDKKIIEHEVVDARVRGHQIVRQAEQEAARIIEDANEQAQETRQHGFEEGKQEALARYTKDITQALLKIQQMEADMEPTYIGLIRTCVEKIIDGELRLHPDAIVGVVRNALRDARQQREIMVRVHPSDAESLQKNKPRLLEMLARAQTIEIRPDESVRRGGCVVVTELGQIDASLERQLEALSIALETELTEGGSYDPNQGGYDEELDPEDDPGYGHR